MKKILMSTAIILTLSGIGGYFWYRTYMTDIIARAVVSESLPPYVPKRFQAKVEKIRAPLNKGAEAMLQKMHASEIPVGRVLKAVDNTTEQEAYAFLDEVNQTKPTSTNEVFDIAKKHFPTDFDLEVFRKPFNEHFEMKQIKKAIAYANMNRRENNIDVSTAKEILKKIIIEKDKVISDRQSVNGHP